MVVRPALAVGAAALYAGLASLTQPLSGVAAVAVAVPAAVVLVRARRPPAARAVPLGTVGRPPAARAVPLGTVRRTAVAWGVLLALAATVELVAFARQPAYDVAVPDLPTLSVLLDPLTSAGPTRFLVWFGWLWVGWQLTRR